MFVESTSLESSKIVGGLFEIDISFFCLLSSLENFLYFGNKSLLHKFNQFPKDCNNIKSKSKVTKTKFIKFDFNQYLQCPYMYNTCDP